MNTPSYCIMGQGSHLILPLPSHYGIGSIPPCLLPLHHRIGLYPNYPSLHVPLTTIDRDRLAVDWKTFLFEIESRRFCESKCNFYVFYRTVVDCKTTGQLIYYKVVTSFKLYNFLGSDGTILLGKRFSVLKKMTIYCLYKFMVYR